MPIANMDPEMRRHVFNTLRSRLLSVSEFRPVPHVWIFEINPDLLVCFGLQHAAFEEGPDLSEHDGMLDLMVKSREPKETV